ncbi:MAG TPA: hypothetical protein VH986_03500 [Acidimicrobiia bacterium]
MTPTRVGSLDGGRLARVDARGTVSPDRAAWDLTWWVGADDRWHVPEHEAAVRQSLLDEMPVVVTAMRVPGGDAVHRVYGAAPGEAVVAVENESAAPFVLALVIRGASAVEVEGAALVVDQRFTLVGARRPSRWAAEVDGTTRQAVVSGEAREGAFPSRRDRGARIVAAFLYPVAHRTIATFRVTLDPRAPAPVARAVPDPTRVARGWRAHLDRGMQARLPEPALQSATDRERAQLLLAGQEWTVDPLVVAALEDWGFDDEARAAWSRLGILARRKASRGRRADATWAEVRGLALSGGAPFLDVLRRALVVERDDAVDLVGEWPPEWRGQGLDVRDAPTRHGNVSYSVRWHGPRAALLWDAPPGIVVRAPGLDPSWTAQDATGEALLGGATG